eukprot:TRINITY_DN12541_c0_g1_i4.p2 TRINITY_DN12541_c0_g1~~TRINITY_DN12541_c0_g1_i4.p2  ORF type:complete len:165 (+),score=36.56 TRINITY_DN12541_c0_g1_i4:300-794(+)
MALSSFLAQSSSVVSPDFGSCSSAPSAQGCEHHVASDQGWVPSSCPHDGLSEGSLHPHPLSHHLVDSQALDDHPHAAAQSPCSGDRCADEAPPAAAATAAAAASWSDGRCVAQDCAAGLGIQASHHHGPIICLLYTSDAADEEDSVDLGGRRVIKKKKDEVINK